WVAARPVLRVEQVTVCGVHGGEILPVDVLVVQGAGFAAGDAVPLVLVLVVVAAELLRGGGADGGERGIVVEQGPPLLRVRGGVHRVGEGVAVGEHVGDRVTGRRGGR